MSKTEIIGQIARIPENLMDELAVWISEFMHRHEIGESATDDGSFSQVEKQALYRIWESYEREPENVISAEQLTTHLREKYAL